MGEWIEGGYVEPSPPGYRTEDGGFTPYGPPSYRGEDGSLIFSRGPGDVNEHGEFVPYQPGYNDDMGFHPARPGNYFNSPTWGPGYVNTKGDFEILQVENHKPMSPYGPASRENFHIAPESGWASKYHDPDYYSLKANSLYESQIIEKYPGLKKYGLTGIQCFYEKIQDTVSQRIRLYVFDIDQKGRVLQTKTAYVWKKDRFVQQTPLQGEEVNNDFWLYKAKNRLQLPVGEGWTVASNAENEIRHIMRAYANDVPDICKPRFIKCVLNSYQIDKPAKDIKEDLKPALKDYYYEDFLEKNKTSSIILRTYIVMKQYGVKNQCSSSPQTIEIHRIIKNALELGLTREKLYDYINPRLIDSDSLLQETIHNTRAQIPELPGYMPPSPEQIEKNQLIQDIVDYYATMLDSNEVKLFQKMVSENVHFWEIVSFESKTLFLNYFTACVNGD